MKKELNWVVIIRDKTYDIMFSADTMKICEGPLKISKMYGLERDGCSYVLTILNNGSYRLYSKEEKKLYTKGRLKAIKFTTKVEKLKQPIKTIH
jgi:hypothetical protein